MIPKFDTERLQLRPYVADDFPHIFRLQSDAEVMRYIRAPATEVAAVQERTSQWLKYGEENPGLGVCMLENSANQSFVGYAVLRHVDFQPGKEMEIGYTLAPESWGMGYATETTKALMQYATKELGIRALVAYTDETNAASNRVLEKCGFLPKGYERIYDANCLRWEWPG